MTRGKPAIVRNLDTGTWYYDPREAGIVLTEPGLKEVGARAEALLRIPDEFLPGLVELLEEMGYIKPRLDDKLRADDLKIIHRLLDLLDKGEQKS